LYCKIALHLGKKWLPKKLNILNGVSFQ